MKQKIGIDARFYGPKGKGLGRYAQKLIEYLEKTDGDSEREYYVFLKKENFGQYSPQHSNFKKVLANFQWYSFAEQLRFPFFLNKFKLDLMHFCHFNVPIFYRKKFIVTIHDLILFHYPTVRNTTLNRYYYYVKLFCYQWAIRSAAKRAEKIIAVSNFTKKDIIDKLGVDSGKVEMTYEGSDFKHYATYENAEEILKKYGIIKPYLLYVGNAYPHKNLERLVLVYKKIKKQHPELTLILVGGADFFYERLKKYAKENAARGVVFPGYVPDEDLDVFYREAKLYVFPSLYEGFGLPPLEALAKNTPVVSSSRTSMPEVLGDVAKYFDPEDLDSMEKAILAALFEGGQKLENEKIIDQLKKFSWERMAVQTKLIYKQSLN